MIIYFFKTFLVRLLTNVCKIPPHHKPKFPIFRFFFSSSDLRKIHLFGCFFKISFVSGKLVEQFKHSYCYEINVLGHHALITEL